MILKESAYKIHFTHCTQIYFHLLLEINEFKVGDVAEQPFNSYPFFAHSFVVHGHNWCQVCIRISGLKMDS